MAARPVMHALIAKDLGGGVVGRTRLVDLGTAYIAVKSKLYVCVGPDPDDLDAMAKWEREQTPPPRSQR